MTKLVTLETQRVKLRQWQDTDRCSFARISADEDVMRYFPSILTESESHAMVEKISNLIAERGWGLWALEIKHGKCFAGFVGLHVPVYDLPFSPCVEIGWRLDKQYWGNGYATEAAKLALEFGFKQLALDEIVSFTTIKNTRSREVMHRLGMRNSRQNFLHPAVDKKSELAEHVLYRIHRNEFASE